MPITATLSSAAPAKVAADVLAVPVFSGRVLGPAARRSTPPPAGRSRPS